MRRIVHPPSPGDWNMAVDEALLESALHHGTATLRLYQWSWPTLSLGYFQKWEEVRDTLPATWRDLDCVRRLSGGGAILHHHELTYSLALPPGHPRSSDPSGVYYAVHEAIISRLAKHGATLTVRRTVVPERNSAFLCFARGDAMDVVHGEHKILGSAQRRRRGAILQHGSLVLRASPFAPQVLGLEDLTGRTWNAESLTAELLDDVGTAFGLEDRGSLTEEELEQAEELRGNYRVGGNPT